MTGVQTCALPILLPISQQSIFPLVRLAYHDYEGVALRDMVLQFSHAPLASMAAAIPELKGIFPLLPPRSVSPCRSGILLALAGLK